MKKIQKYATKSKNNDKAHHTTMLPKGEAKNKTKKLKGDYQVACGE